MADAPSNTDRRPSSPRGKASSEASGYAGVFQAHRQPFLGSVESAPEVRALSSASITRPQRSYGPLRLPSDPPPVRRGGCQPQSRRVSPDDPHHPSNVPCPVPRRIETGACVDCFPAHWAFPVSQAGRHPHLHFRDAMGRTVGRCHHRRWKQRDGASHGTCGTPPRSTGSDRSTASAPRHGSPGSGPLEQGLQGRAMRVGELGGLARRLAVDQARGPMGVELHHPVPHDLHRDPANPGRLGAAAPS